MNRPSLLLCLLALSAAGAAAQTIPAFPGAEGFGAIASGGRGGDVYYVTNRNSSGAGSFAYGVQNAPAAGRTIVFAVSGHIRLPSGSGGGLTIAKNKITVAGQTAPGDGICFYNNTMNVTGNDIVLRHIRWRYGYSTAGGDSLDIASSQRIILDHCDVMFSTDENLSSFGTPPEFFTFQWSVNAWGLSGHSCGGLWDINHATSHHSLWANNHTRNPKCISPSVFDWVNNVTFGWDYGFNMALSTDPVARVNIRGSSFIHGGSTTEAVYGGGQLTPGENVFKLHMSDSALDGKANGVLDVTRTNYGMVSSTQYDQVATAWPQTLNGTVGGPVIGTPVSLDPRLTAYKKVLSQAGATRMEISTRPLRDEITQLCVDRTAAMQRGIISDPLELGLSTGTGQADLQSSTAPLDTDLDGMPDDWEDAVGYSKTAANNNTVLTVQELAASFFPAGSPVGYTQLEEYLHFLSVAHGTVAKNTISSPTSIEIDLRKFTSGFTASPVFTVSQITNGTITQSGPGNAIVRFTPPLETSGRAGFNFTVTDSAGDTWTQQCCLLISTKTQPRPVTWVGDGTTNNWDTSTASFSSFLGSTVFASGDAVTIDDTGSNSPAIKVSSALSPASLTVSNSSKNFILEGNGSIAGTGGLTKTGSGTLTLRINHSGTGRSLIDGGTIILGGPSNTGSLPTGQLTLQNNATITNAWPNSTSTLNIAAPLLVPADESATIQTGRRIQLSGAVTGEGTVNIVHQGTDGTIQLRGAMNTFAGYLNFSYSGTNPALSAVFSGASFNGWSAARVQFPAPLTLSCTTSSTGNTFGIGELTGAGTLGGGSSGAPTYTIGGLNTDSTFSGSFSGNARLTKSGSGTLTLTGNSSHTGATAINAGALALLGNFGASPVTVAPNAILTGTGAMGGSLTVAAGAIIAPGANNGIAPGTLTAASLNLTASTLRFDLSNNPLTNNDSIRVSGGGAIAAGGIQNFIFNLTNGSLSPGTYELITTDGTLTATDATWQSNLPAGTRQTLTLEQSPSGTSPGYVRLVVTGNQAALTWTGANGVWDRQTTAAWSGVSPGTFFNFDNVTFNDAATSGNVTIKEPVAPQSITVNNTASRNYTFTGAPITGTASLTKSGSGSLTLNVPQYTLANSTLTAGSPVVTVSSTANILPGMTVIDASIPAGATVVSVGNATTLTLSQNATATSTTANLVIETRNTFTGGTIVNAGNLTLACNAQQWYTSTTPPPSNAFGLGTGPITLNGGTLTLLGHAIDSRWLSGALPNDLIVPAGKTAILRSTMRGTSGGDFAGLRGSLTGSGTLNLVVNYAYSAITGDWSAFSGALNVSRPATGASDPRFQLGNAAGLPLASVNLDQVTLTYTATPPAEGIVIPVGSLSGTASSIIAGAQNSTAPVTWRVGGLNTSTTFAGNFTQYTGSIGLFKTGNGTWTLTGNGTVSAGITVEQGTLSYGDASTDTLTGTSEISVNPAATLQLNSGARITGSTCEIFTGGTLRGLGSIQAPLNSSGTIAIAGGTIAIAGNTYLGGTVQFSSFSDRLMITGDVNLDAQLAIPTAGLSFGRKPLITYTGGLTLGNVTFPVLPAGYTAILDTSIAGEIAVILLDQAAYQSWQTTNFGNTTNPSGLPDSDPDSDGMTNLEEYQAGTNPNSAASSYPLVWKGGGSNLWDLAVSGNWLENGTTSRVFRNNRQVSFTDAGSNSPAINLFESLQPASVLVNNSAAKAYTFSGSGGLGGPMALSKSGNGTLTIANSNSYTGNTTVTGGGVLIIQDGTALGATANGTFVDGTSRLELSGNITIGPEPLVISGSGGSAFSFGALHSKSGSNTWGGAVTLSGNDTRIGTLSGANLTVAGVISSAPGASGLIVRPYDMASTVTLSGPNAYSGNTTVIGGVLQLSGGDNRLPVGTVVKFGAASVSGVLDLNGTSQTVAGLVMVSGTANSVTNSSGSPATLTLNLSSNATLAPPLTGNLSLTKAGTATLKIADNQTYTGATSVAAGRLDLDFTSLADPTNLLDPASPLVLGNGTLSITGKPGTSATSQTLGSLTVSANCSAMIVLIPNGGTSTNLTLGGTWTFASGATLLLDLSAAGNATVSVNPALEGVAISGVTVKDSGGTGPAVVSAGKIVRYVQPVLDVASNDSGKDFTTLDSIYSGGVLDWTNGGTLTNRSARTLVLDSTKVGGTVSMGTSTNVLTLASGRIVFQGNSDMVLAGGQAGAAASPISIEVNGSKTLTVGSLISGGNGSLTVSGTGTLVLTGNNSYTAGTTLLGGTLRQGVAGAFGSSNATLVINAGLLDLNGLPLGAGNITGTGGLIANNGNGTATLTIGNGNATGGNFQGSIADNTNAGPGKLAVTKTGTGTLTLSGGSSFSGGLAVHAGTLKAGASDVLGSGNVTVSGGTLDLQGFSDTVGIVTLSGGNMTGSGGVLTGASFNLSTGTVSAGLGGTTATLTKSGNYTTSVTLSGANTYGGNTSISGGTLILANPNGISGTSSVDVASSGALRLANGMTVAGKTIRIAGTGANNGVNLGNFDGALIVASGESATWSGPVILGDGSARLGAGANGTLVINGGILGSGTFQNISFSSGSGTNLGTVVLSAPGGTNTFTGNVSIVRGKVRLGAHDALPPTALVDVGSASIVENTTFDLGGFNQTLAGLRRTSTHATQVSTVTNSSPTASVLTLSQSANLTFSGIVSGNLTINKAGTGTLTFSGNTSWSGPTTVTGGKLVLSKGILTSPLISVRSGAVLQSLGAVAGNIVIEPGGTLLALTSLAGNLTVQAGAAFTLTGTTITGNVSNEGTTTLTGNATFPVSGTFANSGTLDLSGWTGSVPGNVVNSGTILLPGGAVQYPAPEVEITSPAAEPVTVTSTSMRLRLVASATCSAPEAILSVAWIKTSGPGTVIFDNPSAASTAAQFSAPGTYVIECTASVGSGAGIASASATRTVVVAPPTLTFRQGENGYSHAATMIRGDGTNATWNSGNRTELLIGRTSSGPLRALFGFDLTGIPSGFSVQSARLDLWTSNPTVGSAGELQLRALTANFTEGTSAGTSASGNETGANWTRRSDLAENLSWTTAGGDFGTETLSAVTAGNVTVAGVQKSFATSPALLDAVRAAIAGTQPLNLIVYSPATEAGGGTNYARFHSDDSATPAQRPLLTLGFSVNEAPSVSAGTAPSAMNGVAAALDGNATSAASSVWSLVSGPGNATFSDVGNPAATVTFSTAGSYVLRLTATNATGETSADLAVTVAPNPGIFSDWQAIKWPGVTDQAIIGESADADRDGIANLLEFATTSDPKSASVAPGVVVPNGLWLEFTYPRLKTSELSFVVEYSDTLAAGSWTAAGVTEEILSDDGSVQSVKALVPVGSGAKRFVRLRIVK